jgi:uncharacterized protein YpuA (DUF1002 family)
VVVVTVTGESALVGIKPAASSEGHKITNDAARPGAITLHETKFIAVRIASSVLNVSFV